MATVTSFEGLDHPSKSELRQFAELFAPLFQASSDEARREAVAALSQCRTVPPAVAAFIACQPISIAAPFLAASPCLDDETLTMVARTQGSAHARAIVRRDNLSPAMIDALVGLRHAGNAAQKPSVNTEVKPAPAAEHTLPVEAAAPVKPTPVAEHRPAAEADNGERLREKIKQLARQISRPADDRLGLRTLTQLQEALLVRFARTREPHHFATTLTDALSASRWLSERIMLDLSGRQLALTLTGLGMGHEDAITVLTGLYPHLAKKSAGALRAETLLVELDPAECHDRVEAWRRADSYTFSPAEREANDRAAAKLRVVAR